jgi:hypothetical protein
MIIFTHINPPQSVTTPDGDGKACMLFQNGNDKSYMVLFDNGTTNTYDEKDITIKEM